MTGGVLQIGAVSAFFSNLVDFVFLKSQMKLQLADGSVCLTQFCCLQINPSEVEALLSRLPCTFRQELTGVGASLEKRWNFCGFQGIKST